MEKIKELERIARLLEPNNDQRHAIFNQTMVFLENYLDETRTGKVFFPGEDENLLPSDFEQGISAEQLFENIDSNISRLGLNAASPYHLAYVPGGGQIYGGIGDFIGAITNKYVGIHSVAPGGVKIENDLVYWMAKLVGYDPLKAGGHLASGGSIANLSAIVAARDDKLEMKDFENAVVYTTSHTHHCIQKALRIAGFKANDMDEEGNIRYIGVDTNFRMIPTELEQAIIADRQNGKIPWLIVASAGTTNFGTIDPLIEIGNIANREDLWFHIDAAYGGYFMLTQQGKEMLDGISLSDSIVLDAHKGMFIAYGLGTVIVKDKEKLLKSFFYQSNYIHDEKATLSPANMSPELTKPFRGLRLWIPLKLLGLKPWKAALEEKLLLARYVSQKFESVPEIEMIARPVLTVVAFRWIPPGKEKEETYLNAFNQELINRIVNEGNVFLSGTWFRPADSNQDRFAIRIAILVFRTHLEHIEVAFKKILEKALELSGDKDWAG